MTPLTVAERLADYVCTVTFDDIPRQAVDTLKTVITHDLGVAIAGSETEEAQRALDYVHHANEGASTARARVIGTNAKASAIDAAFANAVMIRALRQEDSIHPSRTHPGPLLIPAAFALGEQYGCTGREVVTALIAGYDVLAKVAGTGFADNRAYRTPSHTFGAFGTAAVAAKLMGLDRDQTSTALAYAGNLSAVITAGFENHQYGVIVRNGMTAAELGRARAPAPADALEGDAGFYVIQCGKVPSDLDARLERLGSNDEVLSSILKTFPCTGGTLIPVHLLRQVVAEHDIPAGDVTRVTVKRSSTLQPRPFVHHKGPWASASHSISSLPFALAAVLLDGMVTAERWHEPANPAIFELAQLINIEFIDVDNTRYNHVEVHTGHGSRYALDGDVTVLERPDPETTLRTFATPVIGPEKSDRLLGLVQQLERLDTIDDLMDCVAA